MSEQRLVERPEEALPSPTIVIVLGGSGVVTGDRIMGRIRQPGALAPGLASTVQCVAIDTVAPNQQFHPLDGLDLSREYVNLDGDLATFIRRALNEDRDFQAWYEDRIPLNMAYNQEGTSQTPILGLAFLAMHSAVVDERIRQAILETVRLTRLFVEEHAVAEWEPTRLNVHIVASLAGGSGRGMWLYVLEKVGRIATALGLRPEAGGVFYLPGVFEGQVNPRTAAAHRANALGGIAELLLVVQHPEVLPTLAVDVLQRGGQAGMGGVPLRYCYLVDATIGEAKRMATDIEVFETVAEALAATILPGVGGQLGALLSGVRAEIVGGPGSTQVLSSLGISRIMFPRETICAYLAERLFLELIGGALLDRAAPAHDSQAVSSLTATLGAERLAAINDALAAIAAPAVVTEEALREQPRGRQKEAVRAAVDTARAALQDWRKRATVLGDAAVADELELAERRLTIFADARVEGLVFAKEAVLAVKSRLEELVRSERKGREAAERQANEHGQQLDDLLAKGRRRTVLKKAPDHLHGLIAAERDRLLRSYRIEYLDLLLSASGEEESRGEVRMARRQGPALLDRFLRAVDVAIGRLEDLRSRGPFRLKTFGPVGADRGSSVTTRCFPNGADRPDTCSVVQAEFRATVDAKGLSEITGAALRGARERIEEGLVYGLAGPDHAAATEAIRTAVTDLVGEYFGAFLGQSVIDVAMAEGDGELQRAIDNAVALAEPLVHLDRTRPGELDLPEIRVFAGPQAPELAPRGYKPVVSRDPTRFLLLRSVHGFSAEALVAARGWLQDYERSLDGCAPGRSVVTHTPHTRRPWGEHPEQLPAPVGSVRREDRSIRQFAAAQLLAFWRANGATDVEAPVRRAPDGTWVGSVLSSRSNGSFAYGRPESLHTTDTVAAFSIFLQRTDLREAVDAAFGQASRCDWDGTLAAISHSREVLIREQARARRRERDLLGALVEALEDIESEMPLARDRGVEIRL